jgi:hypothetical protein
MCSQGSLQAEEGTAGGVTSEWHQVQVESVLGLAGGARLAGWPGRPPMGGVVSQGISPDELMEVTIAQEMQE